MKPLVLLLCLATAAAAEEPTDLPPPPLPEPAAPAPEGPPPEPPLEQAPPQSPPPQMLQPPYVANPTWKDPPPAATRSATGPGRPLRIAMGLLLGAGVGVLGGLAGLGVGTQALAPDAVPPLGGPLLGALIGWLVGVPIGVVGSGWLFDGDGSLWATLLGEGLGVAAGAVSVWFGGAEGIPVLVGVPLAGAVVGYEASSNESRAALAPTVSLTAHGGVTFGLAGSF